MLWYFVDFRSTSVIEDGMPKDVVKKEEESKPNNQGTLIEEEKAESGRVNKALINVQ